jgi:hypothetical protein
MSKSSSGKRELPLRITLENPPPDVAFALQRGRGELVSIVRSSSDDISFDLTVHVAARPDGLPNMLGPFTQGPPTGRFIYVNSGTLAGDAGSCWTRRAKVSLAGIAWPLIEEVLETPGTLLEARIHGMSRDGGPVCASVPLLGGGWRIAPQESE